MYGYYPDRPYIYLREPVAQLERNANRIAPNAMLIAEP